MVTSEARLLPVARVGVPLWAVDACLLAFLAAVVGAVYWIVNAPLYNPAAAVDPWLYTALFTNFEFTYGAFWNTYYASRLPWVVPGLLTHELFSDRVAFIVLHGAFFLSGAVASFVVIRRFLGRLAAFVAYAVLITNQLYFNAQDWDYVDGAVVTYLLISFACGLTEMRGRLRVAALFAAGFFLMAAVATNLFAVVLAGGFPLLYAATTPLRGFRRRIVTDAAAFAGGVATLLVGGGLLARSWGAGFWFLEPQIRAAQGLDKGMFGSPNYDWIVNEPRLISPLLVLAVGALTLPLAPRRTVADRRSWRFAIAAYTYLLLAELFFVAYQLSGGAALEYPFYTSLLLPAFVMALGAVVYSLSTLAHGAASRVLLLLVATTVAAAPLLLVYRTDTGSVVGRTGTKATLVIGATALAIGAATWVFRRKRTERTVAAIALAAFLAFGVNFSTAVSSTVFAYGASSPINGDVYDLGINFQEFMRSHGFQRHQPYFWYRQADAPELIGIQSLYYYAYTYLGTRMPQIDADFRGRERMWNPRLIVLLCVKPSCRGGPEALRSHGYRLREAARKRLSSGSVAIWARVFSVEHAPT